jgi:hypothetical protein
MKIVSNLLDKETLKLIEDDFEFKSKISQWSVSNIIWEKKLKEFSIGQINQCSVDDNIASRIEDCLNPYLKEYKKIFIQHYIWHPLSNISLHNDSVYLFGATVYLNEHWDINWGGLFVYKDTECYKVVVPEYNTCIINDDCSSHLVTTINPNIQYPRRTIQIWGV